MSAYTPSTNFAAKDALISGNPLKIVKGTEISAEFNSISTVFTSKPDITSTVGSLVMPTGTTAQRDVTPFQGYTRVNSTTGAIEWYNGSTWANVVVPAGNASAGANSDITSLSGITGAVSGPTTLTGAVAGMAVSNVTSINGGQLAGLRNRIIGGDFSMNPWQRGTSFTASNGYTADRWETAKATTTAVIDVLKTADAPTVAEAGGYTAHCLHIDCTTADASLGATDLFNVRQKIEGFNTASFGFGQAGTRYVTLSFWHKHTKIGVYCVSLGNSALNRTYVAEYTQDVTNTWEKATITIPVDTTGTWLYDSGIGLFVFFTFMAGASFQTTANTWGAGQVYATANQVNALDNVANDFKIALAQLEAGSTATTFEQRPYGMELALCQRYFESIPVTPSDTDPNINGQVLTAAIADMSARYKTEKRSASCSVTLSSITQIRIGGTAITPSSGFSVPYTNKHSATIRATHSGLTSAQCANLVGGAGSPAIFVEAEL